MTGFVRKAFHFSAPLIALSCFSSANLADEKPSPPPIKPQAIQTHPITQALVQRGVLACASRINHVSNFLTANGQNSIAYLFTPDVQQDQRLVSLSLELANTSVPLAYASATFAPNQGNGCGSEYETVVYWEKGCEKLAAGQYAGMKSADATKGKILVLEAPGNGARIFLMPAGKGCVSIKKELVN